MSEVKEVRIAKNIFCFSHLFIQLFPILANWYTLASQGISTALTTVWPAVYSDTFGFTTSYSPPQTALVGSNITFTFNFQYPQTLVNLQTVVPNQEVNISFFFCCPPHHFMFTYSFYF